MFGAPEGSNGSRRLGYLKRDNNTANDSFQMMSKGTDKPSPLPFAGDDDTAPLRSTPSQTFQPELPLPCTTSMDDMVLAEHPRHEASGP